MKRVLQLHDLEAKACYCDHEKNWSWKPPNGDTARGIDNLIRKCPRALSGLNIGCAHYYMQEIKWVDWIFVEHLRGHAEKNRLQNDYQRLHQLKLYLDQLTRINAWIHLESLGDPEYVDDPRLAASVLSLPTEDQLRKTFEQIQKWEPGIHITQLLHRADDLIIERMNNFLQEIRDL